MIFFINILACSFLVQGSILQKRSDLDLNLDLVIAVVFSEIIAITGMLEFKVGSFVQPALRTRVCIIYAY